MRFLVSIFFISILFSSYSNAQDLKKGEELYKQCIICHGEKGEGNVAQKAPKLSGQYDWYVSKQLEDMKALKVRKNAVMTPFLNKLSSEDMKDLALYISKL